MRRWAYFSQTSIFEVHLVPDCWGTALYYCAIFEKATIANLAKFNFLSSLILCLDLSLCRTAFSVISCGL